MAIIKCKMCGGDLNIVEGCSTAECEFCGSVQTIPQLDDEKKLIQFERAERLRKQCEFDKAAGIYETIVADFRQEAEAYWGLVLCKYGIEYVDDPATGKKIPTCHRSSFDSVMDDANFELAQENADLAAQKVYREEAKQFERLRKGILEVSSTEKPYDIFICYKETDKNGDRTLDSVLAQDIYKTLADNGYRTFFSRISLEDKLGMEYEPYIFAALNSAKIMLVIGTAYEHFNAVWVKNEWSRFLKLMAQDNEKYLIPCFRGIDAYDMPKEFARLQAQDLGKVGAVQDLMHGIEKLMDKEKETVTVIQERIVVGGLDNKLASLLDRGYMALEDGEWDKADEFFEEVLNNDSKNARAYVGKALVQERCQTMDAFIRKRKEATAKDEYSEARLSEYEAHIQAIVDKYTLENYVAADKLRELYPFDLSYSTQVEYRKNQYRKEEAFWANHKALARAEKFATGAAAEEIQREKKAFLSVFAQRVRQAEEEEATAICDLKERYEAHLQQADIEAEKLYNDGLARFDRYYQNLLNIAKTSDKISVLQEAAQQLYRLDDYKDSRQLAEHCRNRIAEEQEKQKAKQEEERRARLLEEARNKKNRVKTFLLWIGITVILTNLAAVLESIGMADQNAANGVTSEIIAGFFAGTFMNILICGFILFLTFITLLFMLLKGKPAKGLSLITKIFAIIGLAFWGLAGIVGIASSFTQESLNILVCIAFLIYAAIHLLSFVVLSIKAK